jgi:hypothetical protein
LGWALATPFFAACVFTWEANSCFTFQRDSFGAHLDAAGEEDKVEREFQELSAISISIPDHSR